MKSDERASDQSVPPVVPWPSDLTPEEIEAFRREDLLKLVDRNARIFIMSGVVLILFFAFPSLVFSDRYVFRGSHGVSFAWAYYIFGPAFLVAGLGLRKRWRWARMMSLGIAWAGMPAAILVGVLFVRMVLQACDELFRRTLAGGGGATWVPAAVLGMMLAPLGILAFALIWKYARFLTSKEVKALFRDRQED